jgi:hypothetical protein
MPGVFANHAHVFPESVNPQGTIDRLLRLMDECEIEAAVCFAPFAKQVAALPGIQPNRWLAKQLAGTPRLHGFGTIDFQREDFEDQVREAVDLGFRGLKLHPNAQAFDILSPSAFEVYEAAERHDLFVSFHSGVHYYRLLEYRVAHFDEVAHHFPNLRFSLEHVGGYHYFNEALAVLVNRFPPPWIKDKKCNVFAGLASIFTQHQNRFWYLKPEQIMEVILQTSIDQAIFGLDFPYNLEKETKIGLETIRGLPLTDADKDKILGGNLRRELKL